ncbi:MAG: PqqD family peptide modification chaperone [Proteobacteria bacterium]|nr:PqqD family peptide modification chaperone [Pseudomonadota bacterium]
MLIDSLIIKKNNAGITLFDLTNGASYQFNNTGKTIIECLQDGQTEDHIVSKLCNDYAHIPLGQISEDVAKFIKKLNHFGLLRTTDVNVSKIDALCWDITYKCNLSCAHCYLGDIINNHDVNENLLLTVWEQLKDKQIGIIDFSGGEPFLHKHFLSLLQLTTLNNNGVMIKTNATLIDNTTAQLLSQLDNILVVSISLDGPSPEIHDAMRSPGAFQKTVKGIENLAKYGVYTNLVFTSTDFNYPYIENTINLGIRLGANSFQVSTVFSQGRAITNSIELSHNTRKFHFINLDIITKNLKGEIGITSFSDRYDLFVEGKFKRKGCGLTKGNFMIDPSGNIFPCRRFSGMDAHKIGNILGIDFDWEETIHKIKSFSSLTVDNLPKCSLCKIKYLCGGLCRQNAVVHTGDFLGQDPDCHSFRRACETFISWKT